MTFLGLSYPQGFWPLKKLVLYSSIICTELSDRIRPEPLKNLRVAYETKTPISWWVSRHQPCGLGGDKCLLQRVTDMLDVEEHQHMFLGFLVYFLPIVKTCPGQ